MRSSGDVEAAPGGGDRLPQEVLLGRAFTAARAGLVTEALADLERVRQGPWQRLSDLDRAALLTTTLDCRLARGDLAEARSLGEELGSYGALPGLAGAAAHYGLGILASAGGDDDRASQHFTTTAHCVDDDDDADLLPWRAEAALTAVRLGRRTEAVALAQEQVALTRRGQATFGAAIGLRTLASVDPLGDGQGLLRQARALLDHVPSTRLAAQIDTDLAGVLLLSGGGSGSGSGSVEALALLRRAEVYAAGERLEPLQARIRRLLARLGEQSRPLLAEAMATLTTAEHRVAGLARAGMTNKEIAQQLAVTVKAVERHLSHVYRKLGIRSRSGLHHPLEIRA